MSSQSIHPHLNSYRVDVERYFKDRSRTVITNKDRNHAAVLMSTIFREAKNEILLFSRKFEKDFYERGDVANAVLSAAERGIPFKIMIQEDADFPDLIQKLATYPNVTIIRCGPHGEAASAQYNFTVADKTSFRLESDRNTPAAYACANDVEIASRLTQIFREFERNEEDTRIHHGRGESPLVRDSSPLLAAP